MTSHQYGISPFVPQTSFAGFTQANAAFFEILNSCCGGTERLVIESITLSQERIHYCLLSEQ